MEFDVVIVGAGPSGLAAAIRLKQINRRPQHRRGGEGLRSRRAHPVGRGDRSGRRSTNCFRTGARTPIARSRPQVKDDRFYLLTASSLFRLPNFMMPPLMSNHDNYIVSLGNVCRWLAPKAEALGVEIYPGFAAAEVLYDDKGAVRGIATGDMGIARDGSHKRFYTRGMELHGKYTLFAEGARGSLSKQLIANSASTPTAEPQKFGIGLKEIWEIDPAKHSQGLVQHTFGWPLNNDRRRLVPLSLRRQPGVGRLRRASQLRQSLSVAVRRIPALQDPSLDPHRVRRRQAPGLRRPRHHRRRLSVGAAAEFPGRRADRLRGGLRQRAAHQGHAQRDGHRHAGRRTRRRGARRRPRQRRTGRTTKTPGAIPRSARICTGFATPSRCCRSSAPCSEWCLAASTCGPIRCSAFRSSERCRTPKPTARRSTGEDACADRLPEAGRQDLLRQAVVGVHVQHQPRGRPAGSPQGRRPQPAEDLRA